MARQRDPRSPSPAGSHTSRRSRKEDVGAKADRRRDDKGVRRRSRSADRKRRGDDTYQDGDRGNRRSPDRRGTRRDDDYNRSSRHQRSPDRRGRRDRRRNSRDGRVRDRRDVDENGDQHRHHRSPAPRSNASRDDRGVASARFPTKAPPDPKQTDEEKRVERLAKLDAWKQRQAAEREQKEKQESASRRNLRVSDEIVYHANDLPMASSRASPPPVMAVDSAVPYAGKFDPKSIAKKAAPASSESLGALGDDITLPKLARASAAPLPQATDSGSAQLLSILHTRSQAGPLRAGKTSGFGLGMKPISDQNTVPSKHSLDFEDEGPSRKKLEKLPSQSAGETRSDAETVIPDDTAEDDDDGDEAGIEAAGTEEEAAAAARVAAEKREERLLAQSNDQADHSLDVQPPPNNSLDVAMPDAVEDDEELDALDAFMGRLEEPGAIGPQKITGVGKAGSKQQATETLLFDDEDELSTINTNTNDILELASKGRKKKDIPTVNHGKIDYEPFRKDFYAEPAELAALTEDEIAELRLELDGIKVRGLDVPKPVQKWSQCGLGVQTLSVVQQLGFESPTSIQSQAIPAIMSGRDVIGIAKTGSGKTIAFLLPMFRHIKDQRALDSMDGPVSLIMTPTRELATQIHKECKPWLKALNLRAVCAYGGAPIKDQIADLKRGAEIIVCTPGRMIDLLAANSGRVTNLRRVTFVVLDEADRMFDMGFEPQVMKIMTNIRPQRQTVLFSATFPRNMEALARKTLVKPVEIVVGGRSKVAPEIKQLVEVRPEDSKFLRLLQLLGDMHEDEDARSLIFVDRQESAEDLMNAVLKKGYPCFTIHGGKDQYDRDSVISDFKAGIFPVLIATSVAARGLDVKQLKMVVNFDCPNHLEDYVHRAGRTGRAGNLGLAVTFVTEEQGRYAVDIAKALKQSDQEVPEALQKLVDNFLDNVRAGKEKGGISGFGGKGLERLDQERDATRNRERKTYKTGDEPEEEDKEGKEKKDAAVEDVQIVVKPAGTTSAPPTGIPAGIDLDAAIKVHKTEAPAPANPKDRMQGVSAAVAAINARLTKAGDIRGNAPIDNKGPDAGAFHATLEINDFPQKARWAVTNRTNVAKILEATGTSITTKGTFYATGTSPQEGQLPKLYILVEGDTEVVVTNAMMELHRLLREGATAAADSEARAPASGRYSVV